MAAPDERKRSDWRRHLRGWRMGMWVVALGVLAVSLAAPRATRPFVLPAPPFDRRKAEAVDRMEQERARQAVEEPLPHAVRLVGENVRRFGLALVRHPAEVQRIQRELRRDVKRLLQEGQAESLLSLRALQSQLFVDAARAFERTEEVTVELEELGGEFAEHAPAWRRAGKGPITLSDRELRLLFRVRWGALTDTHREAPLGPSSNELVEYYATLLAHPLGADPIARLLSRLTAVEGLSRVDSDFPAAFARGVLYSELGDFAAATAAFEQQARSRGDGQWALLTRNHWLFARSHLE